MYGSQTILRKKCNEIDLSIDFGDKSIFGRDKTYEPRLILATDSEESNFEKHFFNHELSSPRQKW